MATTARQQQNLGIDIAPVLLQGDAPRVIKEMDNLRLYAHHMFSVMGIRSTHAIFACLFEQIKPLVDIHRLQPGVICDLFPPEMGMTTTKVRKYIAEQKELEKERNPAKARMQNMDQARLQAQQARQ